MFFFPIKYMFNKKPENVIKFDIHLQSFTFSIVDIKY